MFDFPQSIYVHLTDYPQNTNSSLRFREKTAGRNHPKRNAARMESYDQLWTEQ